MAELTTADLKPGSRIYQSSRAKWDVLVGEDNALPLIEAISSGDDATLQSLLSQPRWIKTMFEEPHFIYYESRPRTSPEDVREISAMPISTLTRATIIAANKGQAAIMTRLLTFAAQQGMDPNSIITRWAINTAIWHNHAAVYEAMGRMAPDAAVNFNVAHGVLPLYEAVRLRRPEVVAVLLKLGADPLHPVTRMRAALNWTKPILARAAIGEDTRMVEMLLDHGVPIAGSGALHEAAAYGRFDTARLLMHHGADVNEKMPPRSWTPMHKAAWQYRIDAMDFLESHGAHTDVKDDDGKTPAQVLEENKHRDPAIAAQ